MTSPFDGRKVLYHVRYWEPMLTGTIPSPVLVTLDPANRCNLQCRWCNAATQLARSSESYSDETVEALPVFLVNWGVRAVCVAGGGEPTLHRRFSDLINGIVDAGIQVGVVTNGTLLHRHTEALGRCRWVGVSVDAGDREQYRRLKGVDVFRVVLENMRELRRAHPDLEITYKYLIAPGNIDGIYPAACKAKSIGCSYFHARPEGRTWQDVQRGITDSPFTDDERLLAIKVLRDLCRPLEDDTFKVQARTEKVSAVDWGITHPFEACWAIGMTCVIQPDGTAGLCCDRRGDPAMQLCKWSELDDIKAAWGRKRHREILDHVDLSECPRCTYSPHNQVFEQFTSSKDEVCKWFI